MPATDLNKDKANAFSPSPLELIRMVAKHMRSIRLGLMFAVVLVILAFANFVLFIVYEDSMAWLLWVIVAFWFATWVVGFLGLFFLRDLFRASEAFRNWGDKYRQYALLTSFEFRAPTDSRLDHDVVNRLLTAYPDLEEELARRQAKITYTQEIRGKKESHLFEVLIETKAGRLWLVRFRPDNAAEMTLSELNSLDEEIRDIAGKQRCYRIEAILVSKTDFSDEAVVSSRNNEKWRDIRRTRILEVLVRNTGTGFYVASASDDIGKRGTGYV